MSSDDRDERRAVPATVWRLDRPTLLDLMADAVWLERYAERREWVERHVADDSTSYARILLRNSRSWLAKSPSEPDFCWRTMVRVSPEHRPPCIFILDVFDETLAALSAHRVQGQGPAFDVEAILSADDLR